VPYVLAGGLAQIAGQVLVDGVDVSGQSVRERVESGVVLVPGNRQRDGLWPDGTAEENVLFPQTVGARLRPRRRRHDRRTATRLLDRFGVVPPDPDRLAMQYSGGNQQKVVLAKWLSSVPRVLLLDEPTQGVDVGAKLDVLTEVANAARQGCAVVMASGDYEQLAAICHRVLVFKHGRVVAELAGERLTEAALATAVHR
jgi:ribose transport system ATP-binding protein